MCMFFQTRLFWRCMRVSDKKLKNRFEEFFGKSEIEITERDKAIKLLLNIISTIQERILYRLKNENSYDMLMKLYYIFDEVHSFYLSEKEARVKLSELNIDNPSVIDTLFYGLKIIPERNTPAEILKYHPIIFFNTAIAGNQNILVEKPLTPDANDTSFGKGFLKTYGVEFLLFLAAIKSFQDDILRGDDKSLTVISKEYFIYLVENYTNPQIDGNAFYESFVLTKAKVKQQLRKNEDIIWVMGTNKERHELRPFIGLEDGNVLISYGATEQAKQLWVSYFSNGGMCYTNKSDHLSNAMNSRNQELSDILVDKIREMLNDVYTPKIDEKDVKYQRIFGERDINYGDFDVVYYSEQSKELFLIEAKYFSDSLNSSGLVTDYKKLFEKDGYYDHCRRRYDLVMSEPDKIKSFIGVDENISIHLIFLSSKPIELELQDTDKIVTFLSLGIFEKYIAGKLINEDDSIARPIQII